jgi:hypothetical protein
MLNEKRGWTFWKRAAGSAAVVKEAGVVNLAVFRGTIHFHEWGTVRRAVETAVLREERGRKEIAVHFKDNYGGERYTVRLTQRSGNAYDGWYSVKKGASAANAVRCRCYECDGRIALIGEWLQDGRNFFWNCELETTARGRS